MRALLPVALRSPRVYNGTGAPGLDAGVNVFIVQGNRLRPEGIVKVVGQDQAGSPCRPQQFAQAGMVIVTGHREAASTPMEGVSAAHRRQREGPSSFANGCAEAQLGRPHRHSDR